MKALPRRTFLRGAGVTIALPLLDAMVPIHPAARAAAAMAPKRFLSYFVPNGMYFPKFTPQQQGLDYDLPATLEPLVAVKTKVSVLTALESAPGDNWAKDPHPAAGASVLTGRKASPGEVQPNNGISVDQVIANAIGKATRFASLQLGAEGGSGAGDCDGYTCDHMRTISWASPKTPLPKINNAQIAFTRLFGASDLGSTPGEQAKRLALRKSILDYALGDAKRMHQQVGTADRAKLDEFLGSIRQVEERLIGQTAAGVAPKDVGATCTPMEMVPGAGHQGLVGLMQDLMVLAFRCDLTRVITFMWANAGSEIIYFGKPHHKGHTHGNFAKAEIQLIAMGNFAQLLEKLDRIKEGDKSILDSSLVHFTSEFGNADSHSCRPLPVLLAGSAGGAINAGRHVVFPGRTAVAKLFVNILRAFAIPADTFGDDGMGPLPGIST